MKNIKTYEDFNPFDDEPLSSTERHFGKQTRLEKQFSKIVVDGLTGEDDSMFWSTFNTLKMEISSLIDDNTRNELMHRIVESEDPCKVMNDLCSRITQTLEIKRLLTKLNSI